MREFVASSSISNTKLRICRVLARSLLMIPSMFFFSAAILAIFLSFSLLTFAVLFIIASLLLALYLFLMAKLQ